MNVCLILATPVQHVITLEVVLYVLVSLVILEMGFIVQVRLSFVNLSLKKLLLMLFMCRH